METSILRVVHDPAAQASYLADLLQTKTARFLLALGSTRTSDVPNISAAGASPKMRRLTPSIDADLLLTGQPRDGDAFPVSPIGIVSPVVITKACLKLLGIDPVVVDCGTFRSPLKCNLTAGTAVADSVSTGQAIPLASVVSLFEKGRSYAKTFPDSFALREYFIVGECVPGGTTTALAVLKGLGIEADDLVSSSVPAINIEQRKIVELGLERLKDERDPFAVMAAVGDPMQPFVAGFVSEASKHAPIILAGGSQMLAVFHLCRQISHLKSVEFEQANVFVVTTKWVVDDRYSNPAQLSRILKAPFFAANPDFHSSQFEGLRAYEDGHVKEGIGAGALMLAAGIKLNLSTDALMTAIDAVYQDVVLNRGRDLVPS